MTTVTAQAAAQLTRRERALIIGLELLVGIGALFGGYGLLADAEGLGLEESWLEGSPFPDYRIPGLVLLVVIGGGMLAAVALAARSSRHAAAAALLMGIALLAWGLVETATIGYQGWAQLLLLAVFVGPAIPLVSVGARRLRAGAGASGHRISIRSERKET